MRSNTVDRTGERKMTKYGIYATITEYESCRHIVATYDDGAVWKGAYGDWVRDKMSHPNKLRAYFQDKVKDIIGTTSKMKNGHVLRITGYKNCKNVVGKFDTGDVVKFNMHSYRDGTVPLPNINTRAHNKAREYIGKTYTFLNGVTGVVKSYNSGRDVIVELSNGSIIHTSIPQLKKGVGIGGKNSVIGKEYVSTNGVPFTVTERVGRGKVNIKFIDGLTRVVSDQTMHKIKHPAFSLNKQIPFEYHGFRCLFIYKTETDTYYIVTINKYEEILSAKEIIELCMKEGD